MKIIPSIKAHIIKGSWPIFFSKLLDYDEKVRNHLDKLSLSAQIGPVPPSTEIYRYATEQLWSIQVTYSEALRADRLSTFIDACKRNENLTANICIADPEIQLPIIAETEINAIYGKGESEEIQTDIINNGYKRESITKFLYPCFLDYTRKLNDTYAALSLLKIEAETEKVDDQINFYIYKEKHTLRATYIYGEKRILDFVSFPENWIGMTGTMFRCEVLNGITLNTKIFKMAEDECRKLGLNQCNDLMDTIGNKLNENLNELGLDAPSFKANITKDDVEHNRVAIEKKLKDKSSNPHSRSSQNQLLIYSFILSFWSKLIIHQSFLGKIFLKLE